MSLASTAPADHGSSLSPSQNVNGSSKSEAAAAELAPRWVARGTSAYRRISLAFFLAGFATFSMLYCVQPLFPVFSADFGVSPATSSLALSFATGFLAISIFCAAAISEGLGRRSLMFGSMATAAILNIGTAFAPGWPALLALRALEGFALGGVPAVAMAYLAEEIDPRGLSSSMGLYIAGSAFGGMMGRVGTGILAETLSWRPALAIAGIVGLASAVGFIMLVPPSRNFVRQRGFDARYHAQAWTGHMRHAALPLLFAIGFLAMGAFVTVYNFASFRLIAPPYNLNQTELGLIFTVYIFGIAASSVAGTIADRVGRRLVLPAGLIVAALGVSLTLFQDLAVVILGISALTAGFFAAHSVASSWVGRLANGAKGHASALYLLAYYLGSSVAGSAGGWFLAEGGWTGIVLFTLVLLAAGLAAALRLNHVTRHCASSAD